MRDHYAWLASIIDSEGIGIKTNRERHLEAILRIVTPYAKILRTLKQSNYDLIEIEVEPRQPCVSLTRGSQWMDSTWQGIMELTQKKIINCVRYSPAEHFTFSLGQFEFHLTNIINRRQSIEEEQS